MARGIALLVVGLIWVGGGAACAPPQVGPTPGVGYAFSLQVSPPIVRLGAVDMALAAYCAPAATVLVQVQDAQGHPAEGVPVTFALEPAWAQRAALAPATTQTRGGRAWARFFAPQTTGVVRVRARVDQATAQTTLLVLPCEGPWWRDRED
jgi:hypothetical protein